MSIPTITKTQTGWLAHGDGWAVPGKTAAEARNAYQEAEDRHRRIMARPDKVPHDRQEANA